MQLTQAKVEAAEAKAEAAQAKLELKRAERLDTVAFGFTAKEGESSDSFHCGGIKFSMQLGVSSGVSSLDHLCLWLRFATECTVRLKLRVSSYVESAGDSLTPHEVLLEIYEPAFRLDSTSSGEGFLYGFIVRKASEKWPTGTKGERITSFAVDVL